MAETHIFSTGVLTIFPGVRGSSTLPDPTTVLSGSTLLTATETVNSGATYGSPASNIVDGNAGTTAVVNAHTAASPATSNDWFTVDMLQPYTLTQVTVQITAQGAGSNTVNLWIADRYDAKPGDVDTILLDTWAATIATHTTTPSTAYEARYLLIEVVNASASSITIAEVTATVYAGMVLAIVKDIKSSSKTQRKVLYGPAWVNRFPTDVGFFGGNVEFEATNASIRHDTLRKLIAATETTGTDTSNNAATYIETVGKTIALPSFAAVLQTQNTDGSKVQIWTFFNCRAPGVEIPFKIEDFAMPKFNFCAYPDANGNMGQISMTE